MKQVFGLCVVATLISSCCNKVACPTISGLSVSFEGFNRQERDSIYLKGYAPGSDFDVATDSFFLATRSGFSYDDSTIMLESSSHWLIEVPANDDRQYRIGGYTVEKHRCSNGCGFRKGDEYETLSGYTLDGTAHNSTEVIIRKD